MGKVLVINGAKFSKNAIEQINIDVDSDTEQIDHKQYVLKQFSDIVCHGHTGITTQLGQKLTAFTGRNDRGVCLTRIANVNNPYIVGSLTSESLIEVPESVKTIHLDMSGPYHFQLTIFDSNGVMLDSASFATEGNNWDVASGTYNMRTVSGTKYCMITLMKPGTTAEVPTSVTQADLGLTVEVS